MTIASLASIAIATLVLALPASAQDKIVYHLSDGVDQATNGLRNVRNHLEVDPAATIVVVAHARGVDYLFKDARIPAGGQSFESVVQELKGRGVRFEVCEITLRNRNLKKDQFIDDVDYVPSGVQRIGRLQAREGFAYIKP
jgi:uncharacterized protein